VIEALTVVNVKVNLAVSVVAKYQVTEHGLALIAAVSRRQPVPRPRSGWCSPMSRRVSARLRGRSARDAAQHAITHHESGLGRTCIDTGGRQMPSSGGSPPRPTCAARSACCGRGRPDLG
jgi:hypothetical protein